VQAADGRTLRAGILLRDRTAGNNDDALPENLSSRSTHLCERRHSIVKIALIVVASVVTVFAVLLFAVAYFVLGAFHDNKAEDAVAPLEQQLQSVGGLKLCSSGFSGYGVLSDADTPWYSVTYRMPSSTIAKKVFFKEVAKLGYTLVPLKKDYGGKLNEYFNSDPVDGSGLGLGILRNAKLSDVCDGREGAISGKEGLFTVDAPEVRR
jgi:hypothetical protein